VPGTQQILFCNLTDVQRRLYKDYLKSNEVRDCMKGGNSLFRAVTHLRKLCNHPDLLKLVKVVGKPGKVLPDMDDYGAVSRSGKLQVLQHVLRMWHNQKHRVLLFTQTRQVADILQRLVEDEQYSFLRIDGTTTIPQRLPRIDAFNRDSSIFLMLLTTKAGGLGVNLTGADRVLLFDPDWNPSTDAQARERAYRIGQLKDVTVYRLITKGTIEEKVYHRQIFKQFLTNKVLSDPKQKRYFSQSDIRDLFTLGSAQGKAETANIFSDIDGQVLADSDSDVEEAKPDNDPKRAKKGPMTEAKASPSEEVPVKAEGKPP